MRRRGPRLVRWLVLPLLAAAASADRAVERDGTIHKGSAEVGAEAVKIGSKTLPLEAVFLVERDDGALLYAPDFDARMRGYEYLAKDHLCGEFAKLMRECCQVGDFVLARASLESAEAMGLASREALQLKLRLDKEEARRKGGGAVKSDRLRGKMDELNAYYPELLAERAAREYEEKKDGSRLLREALRRGARVQDVLARVAPKEFPVGDARVWLDWHIDLEQAGARVLTGDPPALATARRQWRADLNGVEADEILLLTPVKDSYLIGRCLAHGRLACRVLNELFASRPTPPAKEPLLVFLFGSRDEYLTTTGTGETRESPAFLAYTAGHYSPAEKVSRFFWTSDPDGERRLVGTCVHELTHHWLDRRKPERSTPDQPGFWIVEGFATFLEEGVYDVDSGAYSLENPRSRSLDVLSSIQHGRLIPWTRFYKLTQIDFANLGVDDVTPLTLHWMLRQEMISTTRLFYEQAAATCQYLYHAENGKHRDELLAYVDAYYEGKRDGLDVERAFGMGAAALGAAVEKFAKAR
ncbi:MAG TPA: hypothetical protein VFY93_04015 [Planctomycetota bacterium]|nr:hypothetical protein [Planctomycetota bacterium]